MITTLLLTVLPICIILMYYIIYKITHKTDLEKKEIEEKLKEYENVLDFQSGIPLKNKISNICAGKNIYMIDYENVNTIPKAILKDSGSIIFVFIGNMQKESAKKRMNLLDITSNYYFVNMDKTMHNYLDIFMSCWVGAIISTYTPASIRIISKDKGFSALIEAAKTLGFMDIDYYILNQEYSMSATFIRKTIKDVSLVFASKTVEAKQFRNVLKTIHPDWSPDEINFFFNRATELSYIKFRKVGNKRYIDIDKRKK